MILCESKLELYKKEHVGDENHKSNLFGGPWGSFSGDMMVRYGLTRGDVHGHRQWEWSQRSFK